MAMVDGGSEQAPAAGWYIDPNGQRRWWDGATWGPLDPADLPRAPSRSGAIASHLGIFGSYFVVPVILYLTSDPEDRFTRHHASEATNFQLTFFISYIGCFIGFMLTPTDPMSSWWLIPFVAIMTIGVAYVVLSIVGIIQAARGRWWRYPVRIPFFKGAAPRGTPPLT